MMGDDALDALYWRDEILGVMFWMRGEGLAEDVSPASLAGFLAADPERMAVELVRLAAAGLVIALGDGRYALSEEGRALGARSFADAFDDLTRPAHGECLPGCRCHDPAHAGEVCISLQPEGQR